MKKTLLIFSVLGVLLWTGCAPVELVPEEVPGNSLLKADSTWTLTVRAEMGDPETTGCFNFLPGYYVVRCREHCKMTHGCLDLSR